jgi:hypothetical protein
MHTNTPETLTKSLDDAMPRAIWMTLLKTINLTGVADTRHLQHAIGMERGRLKRRLEPLLVQTLDGAPLIIELDRSIRRPTESNRPAAIYQIGKGGEKLLRHLGYPDARASELKDDVDILHALVMLTVDRAASREKDIEIVTDRILEFDGGRLRPDHQVLHSDGGRYIYEVEQTAYKEIIPRIRRSLENRHAFFRSPQGREYSNQIRVIFNLKDGNIYRKTLRVWKEAMRGVQKDMGTTLSFSLWAIPIKRFLTDPQWGGEPYKEWTRINPGDSPLAGDADERRSPMLARSPLPLDEEAALLEALADESSMSMPEMNWTGDYNMFCVVQAIYDGSHRSDRYRYIPYLSVRLLATYLSRHEELRVQLVKALQFNGSRMSWVPTNVVNRMRLVCNVFLRYHGWSARNAVMEIYPWIDPTHNNGYSVKVHLFGLPEYLRIRQFDYEKSLAWVLLALFEHGLEIGIGRPAFW